MDRYETLKYLLKKSNDKKRIVVSRYNDGEYALMTKLVSRAGGESVGLISDLLNKSITTNGQLVCVNYLKPHNIEKKDMWYDCNKYLIKTGGHNLYGCGNWIIQDFINGSELLSSFFIGETIIVTGNADETIDKFGGFENIHIFETPLTNASENYEEIKYRLIKNCEVDNVLFSCGPIGKVLISDLIARCKANLVDMGSIMNAILSIHKKWHMNWTNDIDMKMHVANFFERLVS
jgi:hypothetical protein